jgi:hypothetical protein
VWIIDPGRRSFGTRLVSLWIGILAAHPLLFFLLGFAFMMMANSVATFGNNLNLQSLVTLSVAVIALFVAALSPLLLLKFAPVIPMGFGGTNGPALSTNSIGARNLTDATSRLGASSASSASRSRPTSAPPGGPGATGSAAGEAASSSAPASLAATSAARAGASAGASTAGAAGAAEGVAAAGAAESATGVGAAIGIPTLVVAGGIAAATKGLQLTEAAGQQATAAVDDTRTIGSERT